MPQGQVSGRTNQMPQGQVSGRTKGNKTLTLMSTNWPVNISLIYSKLYQMKEKLNCHSSIVSLLYWLIRGGLTDERRLKAEG